MKLEELYKLTIEELSKEREALASIASQLKDKKSKVDAKELSLKELEEKLIEREKEISFVESIIELERQVKDREKAVVQAEVQIKETKLRLDKRENELATIHDNQKVKDEKLSERENAVLKRETDYKETLREEFAKNVANSLIFKN